MTTLQMFVPTGMSPYSEPRMFLSTSSVHRGCGAVLGRAAWALWPVACSCGSEGTAREENLNSVGLAFLGPRGPGGIPFLPCP